MRELPAEATPGDQHLQDVVLEQPREPLRVQRVEGMKLLLPIPNAVADQRVQMRVPVELITVSLDGDDGPASGGPVERLGLGVVLECLPGTTRQLSQQPPIPSEGGTQDPGEWSTPVGGDRPLPGPVRSPIPRRPPRAWPGRRDRSSGSCRKRRADTLRGSCHSGCGQSRGGGCHTRESARPFSRRPDERARSLARTRECRPAGIPPGNVPGTGRAHFPEDVSAGRSQVVSSPEQNVRAAQTCERSPGPIGQ